MNIQNKLVGLLCGGLLGLSVFVSVGVQNVFAETHITSDITGSQTWSPSGNPYIISQFITVPENTSLTIEPGTILKFTGSSLISVEGQLHAQGTDSEKISITSNTNDALGGNTNSEDEQGYEYVDADGNTLVVPPEEIIPQPYSFNTFSIKDNGQAHLSNIEVSYADTFLSAHDSSDITFENIDAFDTGTLFDVSGGTVHMSHGFTTTGQLLHLESPGAVIVENSNIKGVGEDAFGFEVKSGSLSISSSTIENFYTGIKSASDYSITLDRVLFDSNTNGVFQSRPAPVLGYVPFFLKKIFTYVLPAVFADTVNMFQIRDSYFKNNTSGIINDYAVCYGNSNPTCAGYPEAGISIDAKNNFWGDASGPTVATNLSGTGDSVSVGVDFANWLTENPLEVKCCSSVMFIPGLEASRLYKPDYNGGTDTLWEPNNNGDVQQLFLGENGQNIRSDIYTRDVVDQLPVSGENIYKSFLSDLESWKDPTKDNLIQDYAVTPYDWRLSFNDLLSYGRNIDGRIYYSGDLRATTTPYIIQELNRLVSSSRSGKVTIVAHSNGGLLAKFLLKKLQDTNDPLLSKVDKLILVATPQTGTPEAVGALLHGFKQGHFPVASEENMRTLGKNMPSVYGLLPSDAYWNGTGGFVTNPVITFSGSGFAPIQNAIDAHGQSIVSKNKLFDFLSGTDGRIEPAIKDIESPLKANQNLLSYADEIHSSLDNWIPPQSIHVDEIAGWGLETLATIEYSSKVSGCLKPGPLGSCIQPRLSWTYNPKTVIDGDGTVVVPSALAMSTSSSNVKRWWINLEEYNKLFSFRLSKEHSNILEIPTLRQFLKNKIATTSLATLDYISENQPSTELTERLHFVLHSPLDLIVHDSNGNSLSSTTQDIPGGRYRRFGEVQHISVPRESNPSITLQGVTSGSFDFDIAEVAGNTTITTTTFASIPSSTTTTVTINLPNGTIGSSSPLFVDYNGDGVVDVTLEAKAGEIVTLTSQDPIPPQVSFSTFSGTQFDRSQKFTASATSSDNIGIASTTVLFRDRSVGNPVRVDLFYEPLGTSTVRALAIDTFGNVASTSRDIRIIATASSTIADIERAYSLGWIKTKTAKDSLITRLKSIIRIEKRMVTIETWVGRKRVLRTVEKVQEVIDQRIARALIAELELYKKGRINDKAYELIKEDLEWMLNN